ncbi:MAG: hypothetical protein RIS79_3058 [Verrucomicrobiota bacterium]|jgi:hypothetical protein
MTPPLLHAEVDTFQVAIIVLAVIFSFVKWLWEQWTGNKSSMPDYDEEPEQPALAPPSRRNASSSQPPPIPLSPPPVAAAPWEELRKAWREVREAAQAQKQPQPRTVAAAARRPTSSRKQVEAASPQLPVASAPVTVPSVPPATVQTSVPNTMLFSLRSLRHDPAAMRRAIVLSEVLGPPKALG